MAVTKEYNLKISTKQAQANIDELNESLKLQEDLIEEIEGDLRKYEKQLADTSGKELSRRKALNDKIKETKARLDEEKAGLKAVTKDRQRANDELKEATENTADYSGVISILDSQTGGAISKIQGMTQTIGGATKGFKLMRAAIIATGIGALVIAITSVATAFTNSEEGQNKFAKLMQQIGVITGNVTDILGNFGSAIIKVFSGDFKGAAESINEVTEGIKNFGEETKKEMKIAGELADMRAKADKQQRELQVERAKADRDRAKLLEQSINKEKFTVEERIGFLQEAAKLEEDITNKEIENARLRLEAKKQENALSASTKEDLEEEAELEAQLIQLETAKLTKQKEVTSQIIAFKQEEAAAIKAVNDEKQRQEDEAIKIQQEKEKELADLKKQIRDAEANTEDERRALELTKIEEHYQALIDKAIANGLATDELEASMRQAKLEKQAEYDTQDEERRQALITKEEEEKQAQLDAEKAIEEQRRATREKTFDNAVLLAGQESKVGKALLLAKQVMLAKKLILDAKEQIANAKKAVTNATVNAAESGTEVAKGASKAAAAAPPPFNIPFILSFAATAVGIVSAMKSAVSATKSAASSAGAGGGASTSIQAPSIQASAPPEVTGVSGSGINQLASAIGEQQQQPVQAYVVSNAVTTAQGLERNIIDSASLG
mgnify:FL=1